MKLFLSFALICTIIFLQIGCCFGLPTATFSYNRPSQSNHCLSNNAARIRAAQQIQAINQVHSLTKGMENSGCSNCNTAQQKSGQQSHTKTVYTEDQQKQELQKHEQEQQKCDQEQKKLECEKIDQQKRDEYIAELYIVHERLLNHQQVSDDFDDHDNTARQQFDNKFVYAIEQVIDGDHSITSVEYVLSVESRSILHDLELSDAHFAHCTGNSVQLQKHEEVVFLANEFGLLHEQSQFQLLSRTMFGFVDGARESNGASNVQASCEITNFCWNILKYVKAVGTGVVSGAASGLLGVAHTVCDPVGTVCNIGSALYNATSFLADIVYDMTCCHVALEQHTIGQFVIAEMAYPSDDIDQIVEKYTEIAKELQQVYQKFRDKTGPEQVHLITAAGTDFIVSGYTYGALARSAGCLYARAAAQLKRLTQGCKKEVAVEHLMACAEGAEIKIATETDALLAKSTESVGEVVGRTEVIGGIAAEIAKEIAAWEFTLGGRTSLIAAGEGNLIKKFTIDVVKRYWEHIFSFDHKKNGVLLLGKEKSEIINAFIDIIKQADFKKLLREGDNLIQTAINSIPATVKIYIKSGEVISINGYVGHSNRIVPHIIKL